jgi:Alpha-2-macroglobulin bait region domain
LKLLIGCNSALESLDLIVIGKDGIIFTQNYPELEGHESFNISFPVTKEMVPEANVVVYFINENNGEVVYDSIKIELGYANDNFVSCKFPINYKYM